MLVIGCGARTSDDELLGSSRDVGSAGGASTGASGGTGGDGATTGGAPATGGGDTASRGDCCTANTTPGCSTRLLEECVCARDPYCCNERWDQACVDQADSECLAACELGGGDDDFGASGGATGSGGSAAAGGSGASSGALDPGNCCSAQTVPSCNQPSIASCVCEFDDYCCQTAWDAQCVDAVSQCGASCELGSGGSASSGGASGSGGAQGSGGSSTWSCEDTFPGACGSCLCQSCESQLDACRTDTGCISILWCIEETSCAGLGCYQSSTCRNVIDAFGGIAGTAAQRALTLYSCTAFSGCPCQ